MAIIITRTDLKNKNGGETLSNGVLVRFIPKGNKGTTTQTFELTYSIKDINGYDSIIPLLEEEIEQDILEYNEETGENDVIGTETVLTKTPLFTNFNQPITIEYTNTLEAFVNSVMPTQPLFTKFVFAYHYMVKTKLEELLGANTCTIRLDLI
jgi:hypothetical protein